MLELKRWLRNEKLALLTDQQILSAFLFQVPVLIDTNLCVVVLAEWRWRWVFGDILLHLTLLILLPYLGDQGKLLVGLTYLFFFDDCVDVNRRIALEFASNKLVTFDLALGNIESLTVEFLFLHFERRLLFLRLILRLRWFTFRPLVDEPLKFMRWMSVSSGSARKRNWVATNTVFRSAFSNGLRIDVLHLCDFSSCSALALPKWSWFEVVV